MKDYYGRLDLPSDASGREIEAELPSLADTVLRRNARYVLLHPERRAVYDRAHRTLRRIGTLRAHLGLNQAPFWRISDCLDFSTEAFGRQRARRFRGAPLALALLVTTALAAGGAFVLLRGAAENPRETASTAAPLSLPTEAPTTGSDEVSLPREESPAAWVAWYPGFHDETAPVRAAWQRLALRLDSEGFERAGVLCRKLEAELGAVDRKRLLPSPEPELDTALERTLDRLASAAAACRKGRFFEMTGALDEALGGWDLVERTLRRHALTP